MLLLIILKSFTYQIYFDRFRDFSNFFSIILILMLKLILLSLVLLTATKKEDESQDDITENIEPAIRTLRFLRGARFLPLKFVLLAYNWKKRLKRVHPQTIKPSHPIIDTR